MKVVAMGRRNALHGRGSTAAGVPSRRTFPTKGWCTGGASGTGPVRLSGWRAAGAGHTGRGVSPGACGGAGGGQQWGGVWRAPGPGAAWQLGCRGKWRWRSTAVQQGSWVPLGGGDASRQPAAPLPRGCCSAPPFSPPSLPPRAAPSPLPRPTRTGDCVLDGDTDPCQSQLGEINMPGLKGLRALGGGGEWAVTHGLPARRSVGHHVPEHPTGSARPGTACRWSERGSGAHLAVPRSLPQPQRRHPCPAGGCAAVLCTCMHGCILPADTRGLHLAGAGSASSQGGCV